MSVNGKHIVLYVSFVEYNFIFCNYILAKFIDYNDFTTKLLEQFQNNIQKESSNSIKNQIARKLAMNDFTKNTDPHSQCRLGLIINYGVFIVITQGLSKIDYKMANLLEKRLVKRRDKLNKTLIYSSDTFVSNENPEKQEVTSAPFSRSVTKTDEISVRPNTEMTSEMKIQVPIKENANIEFKLNGPSTQTKSNTDQLTIAASSHRITLDPFTRMNVTFDFYQYEEISDYSLDFQLDESSAFTHPDYSKNIYYGDRTCCGNCFLFKDTATKTIPFLAFLRENRDIIKSITYGNESVMRLEEINGRFILRNVGQVPILELPFCLGLQNRFLLKCSIKCCLQQSVMKDDNQK